MRGLRSLEVWKLGVVNYIDALKLQEKLALDRKLHRRCDTLLTLQHPLHTLGGDITFHGPHQAILYPIIESTMIELAAMYGVKACPGQIGETGVWVGERKIGAIGITSHGMAFNIDPDLSYFRHIVPCGIADKEVTSLRRETNVVLPEGEIVQEQLISCFARIFGYRNLIWKEDASV
ncbi:hypothetical protein PHAVU_002G015200 [Phaseolus vulgaris]|uniref:lipoyl(octanoyl) transferase n=1 Tax=Phaseolus vulgaris TaxID=3885 RepID=V7CF49_PHAVU|nr:hypothetical protein PHAVU_002G015200g [Phaseolus vulgaris]ESW28754.1 hypothetical protein PHAVU_002G015200g [Phaseolus vulgaris]